MLGVTRDQGDQNTLGFLYDIGCNVEKGILKVRHPRAFHFNHCIYIMMSLGLCT